MLNEGFIWEQNPSVNECEHFEIMSFGFQNLPSKINYY